MPLDQTARISAAQYAATRAIEHAVEEAMRETWNEICSDTDCHPLDIGHSGRRLEFTPAHWARATGQRTAAAVLAMLAGPGGEAMMAAALESRTNPRTATPHIANLLKGNS
jgi:hypothetical protein